MTILDKQQKTEKVKTVISKVIKLRDRADGKVKGSGFYKLNITGVIFNTHETLISILLSS